VNQMDLRLLSGYSGYSKRKIKKHLLPSIFKRLDLEVLENYATIFRISVDQLIAELESE